MHQDQSSSDAGEEWFPTPAAHPAPVLVSGFSRPDASAPLQSAAWHESSLLGYRPDHTAVPDAETARPPGRCASGFAEPARNNNVPTHDVSHAGPASVAGWPYPAPAAIHPLFHTA